MSYTTQYHSPVGEITLGATSDKLVGLWIAGQKYFGATLSDPVQCVQENDVLIATKKWLDRYFSGQQPAISELPLAPSGSKFRQTVWQILTTIPYGQLTTYGDIAKQVAQLLGLPSMSAQAIGGAVGHNPISIIIPCHRVVGQNGSLTGYAGGIDVKIKLLQHEGCNLSKHLAKN